MSESVSDGRSLSVEAISLLFVRRQPRAERCPHGSAARTSCKGSEVTYALARGCSVRLTHHDLSTNDVFHACPVPCRPPGQIGADSAPKWPQRTSDDECLTTTHLLAFRNSPTRTATAGPRSVQAVSEHAKDVHRTIRLRRPRIVTTRLDRFFRAGIPDRRCYIVIFHCPSLLSGGPDFAVIGER